VCSICFRMNWLNWMNWKLWFEQTRFSPRGAASPRCVHIIFDYVKLYWVKLCWMCVNALLVYVRLFATCVIRIIFDYIELYWVDSCWICWTVLCTCKFMHYYIKLCESILQCVVNYITLDHIKSSSNDFIGGDVGASAGVSVHRQYKISWFEKDLGLLKGSIWASFKGLTPGKGGGGRNFWPPLPPPPPLPQGL